MRDKEENFQIRPLPRSECFKHLRGSNAMEGHPLVVMADQNVLT